MAIPNFKIKQPTCPWWFLFTFDNPLRKFYQDPGKILAPYVNKGDRVIDLGCGMGYYSLPLAQLVGKRGQVIAVDLQNRMLEGLKQRAEKADLLDRIQVHKCSQDEIGFIDPVDFVLSFWMVHEVHNSRAFLEQIRDLLKNQGHLLIVEPYIHVSEEKFHQTEIESLQAGFSIKDRPKIGFSRSVLLCKDT